MFYIFIAYGDLTINGDGRLLFDNGTKWGIVCTFGFDDMAGDVACRQLGYVRSTNVYADGSYVNTIIISYSYSKST